MPLKVQSPYKCREEPCIGSGYPILPGSVQVRLTLLLGSGPVDFKYFDFGSVSSWVLILSGCVRNGPDFLKKVPNIYIINQNMFVNHWRHMNGGNTYPINLVFTSFFLTSKHHEISIFTLSNERNFFFQI